MDDYKIPRMIVQTDGVYINAEDLIEDIKRHKEHVGDGQSIISQAYSQAHNHIIELIRLFAEVM